MRTSFELISNKNTNKKIDEASNLHEREVPNGEQGIQSSKDIKELFWERLMEVMVHLDLMVEKKISNKMKCQHSAEASQTQNSHIFQCLSLMRITWQS